MKICVVGSGFTGLLSAIAFKKHCPQHQVVMIDSDREPRNLGFGESGPPDMLTQMLKALQIPEPLQEHWLTDWLVGSNSVIKFNFKWQNFQDRKDNGYFSGIPDMPSYLAVLQPGHLGSFVNHNVARPRNDSYMLYDLWYELYLQGRRSMADFQPDINGFYYYCQEHCMPSYDNTMVTNTMASAHINSFEAGEWLRKRYAKILDEIIVDTVRSIHTDESGKVDYLDMESGQQIVADFFVDCTGFKRIFAKQLNLPWRPVSTEIQHNSVVIVGNGYTENIDREMTPYSVGYGMDHGWAFNIPLLNRKSTGYTYNSNDISADQALAELESLSDPNTRVYDPIKVSWSPGVYNVSADKNFALMGLAATFVDPFDANIIALQFRQIFKLIEHFKNPQDAVLKEFTRVTNAFADAVAERVELHQGLAPRNTSEYWRRNHSIAQRLNLKDKVFDTMNKFEHSTAAMAQGEFIPFLNHLYLSEILYFGIDMSRRCKQSSPELLNIAEQYFQSFNDLNQQRAKISTSMREWYRTHRIDLDQHISFRK